MAEHQVPARRRSCLAVPGVDERTIGKASRAGADEIVIDLEDSVPASGKAAARELATAWLARTDAVDCQVAIRVNAARTPWCHLDVQACVQPGGPPRSIVLPKVESAGDLEFVDRLLDGAEAAAGRSEPVTVQALIETASGLANLRQITAASPRLRTLILGYADLGASLGRSACVPADVWLLVQDRVLVAARAAGLQAVDGPFLNVADDEPFRCAVHRAMELGFDGKWVIHPRQIAAVNAAFTPTEDELVSARAVLDALSEAETRGAGVVALDGRMIDEAVAVAARRVLARAEGR